MKPDARACPLFAVGGGIPGSRRTRGDFGDLRISHGEVANAVGAAIAKVGGEVDRVFHGTGRDKAFRLAIREAEERACAAHVAPASLEVVEREDLPLACCRGTRGGSGSGWWGTRADSAAARHRHSSGKQRFPSASFPKWRSFFKSPILIPGSVLPWEPRGRGYGWRRTAVHRRNWLWVFRAEVPE